MKQLLHKLDKQTLYEEWINKDIEGIKEKNEMATCFYVSVITSNDDESGESNKEYAFPRDGQLARIFCRGKRQLIEMIYHLEKVCIKRTMHSSQGRLVLRNE